MSANAKKIYNYTYLLGVTLVFSALATEVLILYLLVRESFWTEYEPAIVGIMVCTLFSTLGQKFSKIPIGSWIFSISVLSIGVFSEIFISPRTLDYEYTLLPYLFLGFGGGLALDLGGFFSYDWKYITEMKMSKRTIVSMLAISIIGVLILYVVSIHSIEMMSFFDSHPWVVTLIATLITLLGGIFIGSRTRKR